MDLNLLESKTREELLDIAKEMEVADYAGLEKPELIKKITAAETPQQNTTTCGGILEIMTDGYGFLRQSTLLPSPSDIYVSQSQIRRFGLRLGDMVMGQGRPARVGEKYISLLRIEGVNGLNPDTARSRPPFGSLTPTFPDKLINMEIPGNSLSTRLINLIAPVGRGQRGLIVSPPKAGKTMLLKQIANAISTNYEDIHLMVCLIGERPEEVTDMKRSVKGEVIA
ncbi:MAG: Rho termination factor N-terminal domain-containing protein, partial [Dehalococcoidales bacterium]|nr:Rho termination factor N-terminal domain-containing protein [Dehalococcoidales bacterium]